uniref:Uncharacterized protein n=1 Tax=Oryza meridionalis TaxID=40149 RepID=A0A0E0EZA1_9ORYZ
MQCMHTVQYTGRHHLATTRSPGAPHVYRWSQAPTQPNPNPNPNPSLWSSRPCPRPHQSPPRNAIPSPPPPPPRLFRLIHHLLLPPITRRHPSPPTRATTTTTVE